MKKKLAGITLVELIVVIIITAILASLGVANYGKLTEKALDKEAVITLKLIQAAEKIYNNDYAHYFPSSGSADTAQINSALRLSAPITSAKWNYAVSDTATVTATRNISGGRAWTLDILNEIPTCSGLGCS